MAVADNGVEDNACRVQYEEATSDSDCPGDASDSETNHYYTASNLPRGNPQFSSQPDSGYLWSLTVDWS